MSFSTQSSSSGVIPDGGRPFIELWVLDAGNRRTAGASGQSYPKHGARGRGAEPVDVVRTSWNAVNFALITMPTLFMLCLDPGESMKKIRFRKNQKIRKKMYYRGKYGTEMHFACNKFAKRFEFRLFEDEYEKDSRKTHFSRKDQKWN